MDIALPNAGTYVLAVSGGVDSMVLLHVLYGQPGIKLVVAHFDHGIRDDSPADRALVGATARGYNIPFVYQTAGLGPTASEATARTARYKFLHEVQAASHARAIIIAHHQDDILETAIINMLRGTGRKGLTSLQSRHDLIRPLLSVPKKDIITYAQGHKLTWREDSTNQDETHLRNYVRHRILPKFNGKQRQQLLAIIGALHGINIEIDALLATQLHMQTVAGQLDRAWFNRLDHAVAKEVMAAWLRAHGTPGFNAKALERLVVAAKVARAQRSFPVQTGHMMQVNKETLALSHR